jgi:TonB family protein
MRQRPKAREGSTGTTETGGSPLEQALIEAARDQRVHELARVLRDQDDHLEERRTAREEEELRSTERRRHGARARLAARRTSSEESVALDAPVAEAASSPPLGPANEPTSGVTPRPSDEKESDLLAAVLPLQTVVTFALLSLAAHVVVMLLLPTPNASRAMLAVAVTVELDAELVPGVGPATTGGRVPDTAASEVTPGGAHPLDQNVDAADPGVGGDGRGAIEIVLLVPHADPITLTDAPLNATGPSQSSRIDVADDRATFEERRATPNPSDTAFVASGSGEHAERRPESELDARAGARTAPLASSAGIRTDARTPSHAAGAGDERLIDSDRSVGRDGRTDRVEAAAPRDSPGIGILDGDGPRASEAARVATGRPAVDRGTASTTADARGRTRDDVDAELLAARPSESFVESSRRAGTIVDEGEGARDALGAPGVGGGRAAGGRARAMGTGDGGFEALDTSDGRYQRWMLDLIRHLEEHMVWPRARALAMDQGSSVFRVTLRRDGTLIGMRLIRSSGFDDLDRAARVAIESRRFERVPDEIAPGRDEVTVPIRLEWANPMVR